MGVQPSTVVQGPRGDTDARNSSVFVKGRPPPLWMPTFALNGLVPRMSACKAVVALPCGSYQEKSTCGE